MKYYKVTFRKKNYFTLTLNIYIKKTERSRFVICKFSADK